MLHAQWGSSTVHIHYTIQSLSHTQHSRTDCSDASETSQPQISGFLSKKATNWKSTTATDTSTHTYTSLTHYTKNSTDGDVGTL